ncbi:hypothetical protein CNYM01_04298 [Colletotrichum nymphaeae SA-01]|uniref:Uncharacterized protein n=1 Tax=Colletotrichum nymphaeae SA-01 TaxID=1460502 RepID=A0A135UK34_9PEZI|nr:hypothetical protein CNYM01_04298 [Colletotrichum nymphaeae SA-01]
MDNSICLCSSIRLLTKQYDEERARELIPALNSHLEDVRRLLAKSKALSRDVQYQITPRNQRTNKALSVDSIDLAPVKQIYEVFSENVDGFWVASDDRVNADLRRRLACIVIFLRSKLDPEASVPPHIAKPFHGQTNYADIRNSGRKYIQIARKLGGLGSILWLPLDIPPSTYERYLNIDDEEVFNHLISLAPQVTDHADVVQRLILSQLRDPSLKSSYYNLFVDYSELIPAADQLLLLLQAFGAVEIPEVLLKGVRRPQRRWNADGEIDAVDADKFGLSNELVKLISDDVEYSCAIESPNIIKRRLDNDTLALSLCPEFSVFLSRVLRPRTVEELGTVALKVLCFVCPPCYEGNTDWSEPLKLAAWPIVEKTTRAYKVPTPLRTQVLEAILFFCERDSVAMRHVAVDRARSLLRKSMPYYLHATVVLFRSVLYRNDGEFTKSEAHIRDFVWRGPRPVTRRDHSLHGRLHISQMENKIKCTDDDVSLLIYEWKAELPLSTLDTEVTFRLQSTAARFFQSIGNFAAARASLEQTLSLDMTKPLRGNTRRLLVSRLADMYCEMEEYSKAAEILRPELSSSNKPELSRRAYPRLLLSSAEFNIGLGNFDAAELLLRELETQHATPIGIDTLFDQQLHMRAVLAVARIAHFRSDKNVAITRWRYALSEIQRMHALKAEAGFTAATIHLSLAHAQLAAGDAVGASASWAAGSEILKTETCEFWLPIVPTVWLKKVTREVYEAQGWTFRMMLPGAKPDATTP